MYSSTLSNLLDKTIRGSRSSTSQSRENSTSLNTSTQSSTSRFKYSRGRTQQPRQLDAMPDLQQTPVPNRIVPITTTNKQRHLLASPDDLYMRMIERRSASAAAAEERRRPLSDEAQMSVAIASALPPFYLDASSTDPSPASSTYSAGSRRPRSRSMISVNRSDELFIDPMMQPLRMQIDETINQYSSIIVTASSPVI